MVLTSLRTTVSGGQLPRRSGRETGSCCDMSGPLLRTWSSPHLSTWLGPSMDSGRATGATRGLHAASLGEAIQSGDPRAHRHDGPGERAELRVPVGFGLRRHSSDCVQLRLRVSRLHPVLDTEQVARVPGIRGRPSCDWAQRSNVNAVHRRPRSRVLPYRPGYNWSSESDSQTRERPRTSREPLGSGHIVRSHPDEHRRCFGSVQEDAAGGRRRPSPKAACRTVLEGPERVRSGG